MFRDEELLRAVSSQKNRKAAGPDRIPGEALQFVVGSHPQLLLCMYNACLVEEYSWLTGRLARFVLISKGKGGPSYSPSSYQLLCMLDTAGQFLEKLLQPRLHEAIRDAGETNQPAWLSQRPFYCAIVEVVEPVSQAKTVCY